MPLSIVSSSTALETSSISSISELSGGVAAAERVWVGRRGKAGETRRFGGDLLDEAGWRDIVEAAVDCIKRFSGQYSARNSFGAHERVY